MNLGHGAIDPPPGSHLPPMQDVLALNVGQLRHTLISVQTEITEYTVKCQAPYVQQLVAVAPLQAEPMRVLTVEEGKAAKMRGSKLFWLKTEKWSHKRLN